MQMCVCLKEHIRVDDVFCALCIVCLGSAVSWNRQGCNRQSIQWVQNTWSTGIGLLLNALTLVACRGLVMPEATASSYDPLRISSNQQWHMVVILTGYMLFLTSQHDVIFMFANQRFGKVC